jgi:hypothetical protein
MKYIIVDHDGIEQAYFCVAPVTHSDLAAAWRREPARVVSAGFCEFTPEGVRTFGYSVSLRMGPRAVDAGIIRAFYQETVAQGGPR